MEGGASTPVLSDDGSKPTMALFAIYSSAPLPPHASDDDAALEASKVLFFSAAQDSLSKERKARLMGTVIGMADFARMLSPPGDAPAVRSLHSLLQRMVWLEPEKGLFIHAAVTLPRSRRARTASTATNASGGSAATVTSSLNPGAGQALEDAALLASIAAGYRSFRLSHGGFRQMLEKDNGREILIATLDGFWAGWVKNWKVERDTSMAFERSVGGLKNSPMCTTTTIAQLAPLLNQFAASHSFAIPILLHNSAVLYLPKTRPSPPRAVHPTPSTGSLSSTNATPSTLRPLRAPPPAVSEEDLVALVEYLAASTSEPQSIAVNISRPDKKTKTNTASSTGNEGASVPWPSPSTKWSTYYTLGLSNLTAPSMPSISIPSVSSISSLPIPLSLSSTSSRGGTPPTTNSSGDKGKGASSTWGLRNVAWGLGLGGHSKSNSTSSSSTSPRIPAPIGQELSSNHPEAGASGPDPEPNTTELPSFTDNASSTDHPHVAETLARNLDEISLAEAMDDSESLLESVPSNAEQSSVSESEGTDDDSSLLTSPLSLFFGGGGESDVRVEVRRVTRGPLTFALVTLPITEEGMADWLTSRAAILLEAVESVVESSVPFSTSYPNRHLIKTGLLTRSHGWPSNDEVWAAQTSVESSDAAATLFDCLRGSENSSSPALETFVRINTSEWVVSRRSLDSVVSPMTSTSVGPTDVYAVLPATVGKEGSLVDAGEEMRKLDRAYPFAALS